MQIEKIISGKLDNNTYILKNDKKQCLIIDAAANLEDIIQKVGDFAVEGVLLTHGHYDHFVNL
ncbi:MAG: MBL fold metallo-hydrolase, partial [Clostridia bacterium]|nr:MBL fold metallo-hydrolase [Clostridia bacterium]